MTPLQTKLIEITKNDGGKYTSSRMTLSFFEKNYPSLIPEILSATDFYNNEDINFTKRILLVIDGIMGKITCAVCSKNIDPMKRAEPGINFRKLCSSTCAGLANKGLIHVRTPEKQLEINDKRSATMLSVHGYEFNSQRPEVKEILSAKKYETHNTIRYDLLNDATYLTDLYKTYPSTEIGEICNCDYSVVLDYLRKYGVSIGTDHTKISKEQREIGDFVESLGLEIIMNAKVLGNQDIDVFVPSLNVGIEFNGFPWHLENFTDNKRGRMYHLIKTEIAKSQNIRLIHVFPHDLYDNKSVIFSIIKNALHKTPTRLYGRKCTVSLVDKIVAKTFLNKNHLKGNSNFDYAIGLYDNGILVHVTTFGKSRFDLKYKYEVIRSATLVDTLVIGGFSKCFSHFENIYCVSGDTIMTYADRSISEGLSYLKAGFKFVRETEPSYHYTERCNGGFVVHSRYKFQKYKLKDFEKYSDTKTEWEIMVESGYDRFWDSGNNMYSYTV